MLDCGWLWPAIRERICRHSPSLLWQWFCARI